MNLDPIDPKHPDDRALGVFFLLVVVIALLALLF